MKPWKGWAIVDRRTGQPAFHLLGQHPLLCRTKEAAQNWIRQSMQVSDETHKPLRVTVSAGEGR